MELKDNKELTHSLPKSENNIMVQKLLTNNPTAKLDNYTLTFKDAQESNLPIFRYLEKNDALICKAATLELIQEYIDIYYPGTNTQIVAIEFVNLIFTNYYTWNIIDVQAFINHIKKPENKPQTIGHKISPNELMECVRNYESSKLEYQESLYHNFKQKEKELLFEGEPGDGFKKLVKHFEEKGAQKARERELEREIYYNNLKKNNATS